MAVGDDATAAGFDILDPGIDLVKDGATEINRTRDLLAQVLALIPKTKPAYRTAAGIYSGTDVPLDTFGANGDIYFRTTN